MGWPAGQEMDVLELMVSRPDREWYGLELVKAAPDKLGRNTIYVVLMRMVARGYLTGREETDAEQTRRGPKRRLYKFTAYGKAQFDARVAAERAAEESMKASGAIKPANAI